MNIQLGVDSGTLGIIREGVGGVIGITKNVLYPMALQKAIIMCWLGWGLTVATIVCSIYFAILLINKSEEDDIPSSAISIAVALIFLAIILSLCSSCMLSPQLGAIEILRNLMR